MNYFSQNLKFLRESKNMSKSELAQKLNVNQSTISRWENNEMGITLENAYDISDFFNISVADFTGIDLSKKKNDTISEFDLLFDKHKDILSESDKNIIKAIIEQRKKEIDREQGNG